MAASSVIDAKQPILYLLKRSLIGFVIGCDFGMVFFDLVSHLRKVIILVALARFAENQAVGEAS